VVNPNYFSLHEYISLIRNALLFSKRLMKRPCQHCGELITGNAYRVTSEEEGMTLLNMVVCALCGMEAKRLGLHTGEINVKSKRSSPRKSMPINDHPATKGRHR
jgi:RNase P subunit RPR2